MSPRVTRRQVLAVTAGAGLASALGVGLTAASWWDRPPAAGLRALDPTEYAFLQALGEAAFPAGGSPPLSGAEADVGRFFDELVDIMPEATGRQVKLLLQALDRATYLTDAAPYHQLDAARRTEVLQGWLHHRSALLRSGVQTVFVLVAEAYTSHPAVASTLRPYFRCGYGR